MPGDHQQKQGPPRAHTKVPIGLLLCEMDKFDLKLYVACILNFHRHFLRGQIASIKIIISRLYRQCTLYKPCTKSRSSNLSYFPSGLHLCWNHFLPREPGGSLGKHCVGVSASTQVSFSALGQLIISLLQAGSCFPCLACIRTGIKPNMSQGMTGGPSATYTGRNS